MDRANAENQQDGEGTFQDLYGSVFGSSLACLEPELELFEVWEINVRRTSSSPMASTPKLQRALTWVLDELERNQKKENYLHTISKMMGSIVHAQL